MVRPVRLSLLLIAAAFPVTLVHGQSAPVVTAGDTITFRARTPDMDAPTISPGLSVTDSDSANLVSATITVTPHYTSETLLFSNQNGISRQFLDFDSQSMTLSLIGSSSIANYQAALRSVRFWTDQHDPTAGGLYPTRTVTFKVNDGSANSAPVTSTIIINSNAAPIHGEGGHSTFFTENGPPVPAGGQVEVLDFDDANLVSATVSFTQGFLPGDTLSFVDQNGITGSYSSGTGVLSLSGLATVANYEDALRSVTFSTGSDNPTASGASPYRNLLFVVSDGGGPSLGEIANVFITAVNDNPTGGADSIQRSYDDPVKVKVSTLLANDSDVDGGTLSISGVTSPTAGGATVTMSEGWIFYNHVGGTSDSFKYTLSDGQGGTTLVTVNVNIQPQDQQAGPALTPTVDVNGAHVTFTSIPARIYTVQSASSVNGPWIDRGQATEQSTGHYAFDDASLSPANFYRAVYRQP